IGEEYTCWYDPDNPHKAVLVLGYSWLHYLFFLLPLIFIAIGGLRIYFPLDPRNCFPQQRAPSAPGGKSGGFLTHRGVEYPTVPDRDLTESPGSTLRYRVPIGVAPGIKLLGFLALALFWNGIVSIFVVLAVSDFLHGKPDWCMTIFVSVFVLIG